MGSDVPKVSPGPCLLGIVDVDELMSGHNDSLAKAVKEREQVLQRMKPASVTLRAIGEGLYGMSIDKYHVMEGHIYTDITPGTYV